MRNKTTVNYFRKIKAQMPPEKFEKIEKNLFKVQNEQLEAFWNIVSAGYTVEFAIKNYLNLYEYVREKQIDYLEALRIIYTIYPGLNAGIYIKKPESFELN